MHVAYEKNDSIAPELGLSQIWYRRNRMAVGVEETPTPLPSRQTLRWYPAPDGVWFEVPETWRNQELRVYDRTGRLVWRHRVQQKRIFWPGKSVSAGLYFLKIEGEKTRGTPVLLIR